MPPKVVKRGGAARRGGRLTRSNLKTQNTPVESANDESVNIGEVSGSDVVEASEVDRSIEEENLLDGLNPADSIDASEAVANPDGVVLSKKNPETKMYNRKPLEKKKEVMESTDLNLSFRKIMKDVEQFSSSHMTWKDKKALENKKVTELGGKPQKKQRLPLSVARVQMKKQKEREEKMSEHNTILDRFGGQFGGGSSTKKPIERKRTLEERVLKSTVGNFKGGVLDVRHLLHSSRSNNRDYEPSNNRGGGGEGGHKSKGKGNKGKKKGGGKRIKK